jgi:hypothetical protein
MFAAKNAVNVTGIHRMWLVSRLWTWGAGARRELVIRDRHGASIDPLTPILTSGQLLPLTVFGKVRVGRPANSIATMHWSNSYCRSTPTEIDIRSRK